LTGLTKLEVARRHLGTALWLYLEDLDPVSVHTLAGAGAEISEHLARDIGASPFVEHVLQTNPTMARAEYYALARQYYNAFKHETDRSGGRRDDLALLSAFGDEKNDGLLFIAWSDLSAAMGAWPIEVQVFQAWFYAMAPDKLADRATAVRMEAIFPGVRDLSRKHQKRALNEQIALARSDPALMGHTDTDPRPLVWGFTN
jgi:hypothetical protein